MFWETTTSLPLNICPIMENSVSKNGVLYLSEPQSEKFENAYLDLRKKENRLLADEQVRSLPFLAQHPLSNEWKMRQFSSNLFLSYVYQKSFTTIVEVGCGNGWFAHKIAQQNPSFNVWGTDINVFELEQAARVFKATPNLRFAYWDIFQFHANAPKPGLVVLNASAQYFESLPQLIKQLFKIMKAFGEIHILDTPFYKIDEIPKAKLRTSDYYKSHQADDLMLHYHHHTIQEIEKQFTVQVMYQPKSLKSLISKFLHKNYSPFMWLKITK